MTPSIAYEKDREKKKVMNKCDVKYDTKGKNQCYSNMQKKKGVEDRCCIKYTCGSRAAAGAGSMAKRSLANTMMVSHMPPKPKATGRKSSKRSSRSSSSSRRMKVSRGGQRKMSLDSQMVALRSGQIMASHDDQVMSRRSGQVMASQVMGRRSDQIMASHDDQAMGRRSGQVSHDDQMISPRGGQTMSSASSSPISKKRQHTVASSKGGNHAASAAALTRQEELCGTGAGGYRKLSPIEVSAECYQIRRAPKKQREPCREISWQHGKYVRDQCGSGIVPVRFDIGPCKRLWCKTPLSMYQATIGDLGKQLLCRERTIPRDVWPGPPCNMSEYIMPPCRGYYRKYDCIRPCEEDHAYIKQGKKYYRDRVERYWEPCLTQEQKHTLNVNEYGPQNAALALKLRRENMGIPCW